MAFREPLPGASPHRLRHLLAALSGVALLTLTACGSGSSPQVQIPASDTAPVLTTQPASLTADEGATATFTVVATGQNLTYQWKKNGTDLAGATAATYTTAALTPADHGATFTVVVRSGNASTTSAAATLSVFQRPRITGQPQNISVQEGQAATFTVTATGDALTYQWARNGAPVSGATQASLRLAAPALADSGTRYTVTVTNRLASATSAEATLTVTPATPALAIVTHPTAQTVTAPAGATFQVTATGSNLRYQWRKNGADIPGATQASFTTDATDLKMVPDTYTVLVGDGVTTLESNSASFTSVAPNPFYPQGGRPTALPPRTLTVVNSLRTDPVKFPAGSFQVGYDEAMKNAAWTAYAIFKVQSTFPNSDGDYQTDMRLAAPQVTKGDMGTHGGEGFYLANGLGFDRGHLVTRSDVSYRYGAQAGDDATYMSNLIPQVSQFNQRIWQDLEETVGGRFNSGTFTNGMTATKGRVWIYTGPVFTGTTDFWIPSQDLYTRNPGALPAGTLAIGIPTACYKIMVSEPGPGETLPRVMAWLGANRPYTSAEAADLWKYTTTLERVETLTGLDFFPDLPKNAASATWRATVDVRGWGAPFEKTNAPNVHMIQPSWDLVDITGNPVLKGEPVKVGDAVTFEGAATMGNPGATLASTTWTFGDGGTATGLKATHTFAAAGTYTVTFTATDSLGASSSITRQVTAKADPGNLPPVIPAIADQAATLGTPKTITFLVSDDKTPAGNLTVTATSNNQTVNAR